MVEKKVDAVRLSKIKQTVLLQACFGICNMRRITQISERKLLCIPVVV
jgi:hypothetical protein